MFQNFQTCLKIFAVLFLPFITFHAESQVTIRRQQNLINYATITAAVNASVNYDILDVAAGTYDENVIIDKPMQIVGAGVDKSIVRGTKQTNNSASTFLVNSTGVNISGFTITRSGNTVAEWNSGLDTAGIVVAGVTFVDINGNKLTGNQYGIVLKNSSYDSVTNNIIDFNRVGILIVKDQPINNDYYFAQINSNRITNNWATAILFGGEYATTKDHLDFSGNFLDGNWYSEIENLTDYGGPKSFQRNWLGTNPPTTAISATPPEPDYANQIPQLYGGTARPPVTGAVSIQASSNQALNDVVYSPYYIDTAMTTLGSVLATATLTAPITIGSTTVSVAIPAGVTVTTPPNQYWDGVINPPAPYAGSTFNAPAGFLVSNNVIQVGSPYTTLFFSLPAVLTFTNITGPVGYSVPNTDVWTVISDICGGTYDNPANPVSTTGACTISNGVDTKVLTYHFTLFGVLIGQFGVSIPAAFALPTGSDPNTVYIGYAPASSITLTATPKYGSGSYSYLWNTGATTASITVSPTTATAYSVNVRDQRSGSNQSASVQVKVVDVRCGDKGDNVEVCKMPPGNSSNAYTICVSTNAVESQLKDGSRLGNCLNIGNTRTFAETITANALQVKAVSKLTVGISQNPAINTFTLNFRSNKNTLSRLVVVDLLGRVVEQRNNIPVNSILTIGENYQRGVYIADIIQGGQRVAIKLVKTGL